MIGIANVNCSSLALTVFLRLPAQKDTVHDALSEFTIKIIKYIIRILLLQQ